MDQLRELESKVTPAREERTAISQQITFPAETLIYDLGHNPRGKKLRRKLQKIDVADLHIGP